MTLDVADALRAFAGELAQAGAVQTGGSFTDLAEADVFVKTVPEAFLVGVLFTQGIPAERIRVLAFNREAAKEFQTRLAGALPSHRAAPKVSTFHSLGLSLTALFEKQDLLPRRRLEASEAVEKKLAREAALAALKEEGSDEYPSQDAFEAFRAFIGLVKSDLLYAADAFRTFGLLPSCAYFVRAFPLFEQARERAGLRFFADLLSDPVAMMRANSKALALVTTKLDVVVVDEFQDVSRVQVELLIQLVGTRAHLNAVGDDSQCIYAWRGARPEIMGEEFARHFPRPATPYPGPSASATGCRWPPPS